MSSFVVQAPTVNVPAETFPVRTLRNSLTVALLWGMLASAAMGQNNPPPRIGLAWKRSGLATVKYEINGSSSRSNPLRRRLQQPFSGSELYFRYRIRYDAKSIDSPPRGDGEFVVFWLDDHEGNDGSTHSGGVPNAGIHVAGNANRFMVRYSPGSQKFGDALVGDQDFLVVGRLWKSQPGDEKPFDRLALWVDPDGKDQDRPQATSSSPKAIRAVSWVGFSTGVKTEIDDRIIVWDVGVADNWAEILGLPSVASAPKVAERTVHFQRDVLPVLKTHCFDCHAGEDAEDGVRLDVLDEVLNRTTPRKAEASRLYQLAAAGKMPPNGERLKDNELAVLRAWINEGLDWDEQLLPTPVPQSKHWAFQRIKRPAIPTVRNAGWIRTPVDAFIAKKQEELGVHPAPPAAAATLDRRVTLDLLGLPPEMVELQQPAANINQLLAHSAYGERWGRHWLDVARWAESNGHQHNRDRKHAWRYRDWVVDAFNTNKPYDEFIREQIAGDELTPVSDANLVATGFLAAARYSGNELDKQIQRHDILTDVTNATASALLGVTMECAQCHTHKFDPITIRDYYRFQAFFAKGQPANVLLDPSSTDVNSIIRERWDIFESVRAKLIAAKRRQGTANPIVIPKSVFAAIKGKQRQRFDELEKQIKSLSQSWAWQSATSAHPDAVAPHDMRFPLPRDPSALANIKTYLLIRGDVKSPGPVVEPGWPRVFGAAQPEVHSEVQSKTQSGASERQSGAQLAAGSSDRGEASLLDKPRVALASWLVNPSNPLTARVWVNRIWQWHFGRGLVETSSDFGTQGAPPTHPHLLDYLASELIENKWNTNHIHRLILESATYRQSHAFSKHNSSLDPENRSYWRWTPRRLEAEAIRDSILAVSGQLDTTRGGPSVSDSSHRRSIYVKQRRNNLPHQLQLFDGANSDLSCSRRRVSTTSLQPLWLLNSKFMQQAAEKFALRSQTVERAFKTAMNREPDEHELHLLRGLEREYGLDSVCLAILNASEFLYLR